MGNAKRLLWPAQADPPHVHGLGGVGDWAVVDTFCRWDCMFPRCSFPLPSCWHSEYGFSKRAGARVRATFSRPR